MTTARSVLVAAFLAAVPFHGTSAQGTAPAIDTPHLVQSRVNATSKLTPVYEIAGFLTALSVYDESVQCDALVASMAFLKDTE